jgi:hypothetical protein
LAARVGGSGGAPPQALRCHPLRGLKEIGSSDIELCSDIQEEARECTNTLTRFVLAKLFPD